MFKIGDKVRVNERCVEDDGHRYHGMVGTVVDYQPAWKFPYGVEFENDRDGTLTYDYFGESEIDLVEGIE